MTELWIAMQPPLSPLFSGLSKPKDLSLQQHLSSPSPGRKSSVIYSPCHTRAGVRTAEHGEKISQGSSICSARGPSAFLHQKKTPRCAEGRGGQMPPAWASGFTAMKKAGLLLRNTCLSAVLDKGHNDRERTEAEWGKGGLVSAGGGVPQRCG